MTGAAPGSPPGAIAAVIDRLTRGVGPLLVVVDFDGTLAVGTRDPAAARITTSARRALRALARPGASGPGRVQVTVLTGRTVARCRARACASAASSTSAITGCSTRSCHVTGGSTVSSSRRIRRGTAIRRPPRRWRARSR